jgi:4'-phosphopantetheinyl transferase
MIVVRNINNVRTASGALACAFSSRAKFPQLASDAAHVWIVHTGQLPSDCEKIKCFLSVDECEKADRFVFERDRERYIIRRALLRMILGHYLALRPEEVLFRYNQYGKPMLDNKDLFFNLSSSFDCTIYAVAHGRQVGVDIEKIRAFSEMKSVAKRSFSPAEFKFYCSRMKAATQKVFFKYWTRKEALIKAIGSGLSIPLDTFDVSGDAGEAIRPVEIELSKGNQSHWMIFDLDHRPGFASAAAIEGSIAPAFCVRTFNLSCKGSLPIFLSKKSADRF